MTSGEPSQIKKNLTCDAHAHVFCWGEKPEEGFISESVQKSLLTRLLLSLVKIKRESGDTLSEKLTNRLLRDLDASDLDYAVVLAQDAIYRPDGTCDNKATPFYVSNRYVESLTNRSEKIIPGASINPFRPDALQELERCRNAGCRLVKIHTAIQGVDPGDSRFAPFYKLSGELGMVLMFHTGYEHSSPVVDQGFANPRRLARVLDMGLPVIAAHCGTCAFFDKEDFFPDFLHMMREYDNLYGDTSIMASYVRLRSLKKLSREPEGIRNRIIHGSDYPFPPARAPYLRRTGLRAIRKRKNVFDMDLNIKKSFNFGANYTDTILKLIL